MTLTKEEALKLMKEHGHTFGYCKMCGPMVHCGFCGNNCCNGGSGSRKIENGEWVDVPCSDHCKEAYVIQNLNIDPWYNKLRFWLKITWHLIYTFKRRMIYKYRNKNEKK